MASALSSPFPLAGKRNIDFPMPPSWGNSCPRIVTYRQKYMKNNLISYTQQVVQICFATMLCKTHMFYILDVNTGQVFELKAVLLETSRLFHPNSSLIQREFMPRPNQSVWQPISDCTNSLGAMGKDNNKQSNKWKHNIYNWAKCHTKRWECLWEAELSHRY